MMVVILTPVDGIIRWLPRGFSCSPKSLLSAKELAAILEKEYPHLDVDNASIYQNEAGGVRRAR